MQWLYRNLRRTRPAPLAELMKWALRIERQVIPTPDGHRFWVDPVSNFGGTIMETGTYEPALTELIKTLLQPGDSFVDVGANEGYFSVLASRIVGAKGRVFSIEPQSRLIPVIQENLNLLKKDADIGNVAVFHEAFAQQEGETTLYLTSNTNSGGTSFYKHWRFGAGEEKVQTRTLDAFFKQNSLDRVRMIKLDCEGAEQSILEGAYQTLGERKADFISVDFHPGIVGEGASVQIDQLLRKSGYLLSEAGTGIWVYHLPGLEGNLLPLGVAKYVLPLVA